jgi:hypothetical protein
MVFCECGIDGCMTPIEMTVPEYEATREAPGRWVVSSEHVPSVDSMLDHRNGYALIRDVPARLSTEAEAPRKESTSPPTATELSSP